MYVDEETVECKVEDDHSTVPFFFFFLIRSCSNMLRPDNLRSINPWRSLTAYKFGGWARIGHKREGGGWPPFSMACFVRFAHWEIDAKVLRPSFDAVKVLIGRG